MQFTFKRPVNHNISKPEPREKEWQAIHRIADKYEPRVREAFLAAVREVKDAVVLKDIREALEQGDLERAIDLVPVGRFSTALGGAGLTMAYVNMIQEAADETKKFLPKEISTQLTFNVTNERSVEFIRERTAELVTEVTEGQRDALRNVALRSFEDGMHPYKQAKHIKSIVGLTERQATAVDNMRSKLKEKGLNDEVVEERTKAYADKQLRYRAERIARTETIKASNMGQQRLWEQAADEGLIDRTKTVRRWITHFDERTCPWCAPLDGTEVPLEGEFSQTVLTPTSLSRTQSAMVPPLHVNCRCSMELVFKD